MTATDPFEDATAPDVAATPASPSQGPTLHTNDASKSPEPETTTTPPISTSDAPTSPGGDASDNNSSFATTEVHAPPRTEPSHVREPTPPLPPRDQERPIPSGVEGLKAMFPDFDVVVLQSVLESVNGDQERAVDLLLGMSDPNYVPQEHSTPAQSQTDLDEQLARRLVLEEQQQEAGWQPDQQHWQGQGPGGVNMPYQPRVPGGGGGRHSAPQPQWGGQQGGGRDTMDQVQEQFSKIAETGKKTFSSLMGKVKAKMQEFDQSRNQSGQPSQSSWGSGTPSGGSYNAQQQQQYQSPNQPPHQPQYFAPSPTPRSQTQGYDASPVPQQQGPSVPAANRALSSDSGDIVISSSPPPVTAPRPPSAGPPPAGNVDPTKIGMLPKRPVSLLDSTPQQSNNAHRDDDDELDYVENPFEEGRH